jgi:hypothetical protein
MDEKKRKMLSEIRGIIDHSKLSISESKLDELIAQFVENILVTSEENLPVVERQTVNQGCQTDKDARITKA